MIKVLFVCYGNICRSPMAEFLFKDFVRKKGVADKFYISSAATSDEEEGHAVHYGTRRVLDRLGIDYGGKRARRIVRADYYGYDYIIGMDEANVYDLKKAFNGDPDGKIYKMLDFTAKKGDVADPWFTGDFELTYRDISEGIKGFFEFLTENKRTK